MFSKRNNCITSVVAQIFFWFKSFQTSDFYFPLSQIMLISTAQRKIKIKGTVSRYF